MGYPKMGYSLECLRYFKIIFHTKTLFFYIFFWGGMPLCTIFEHVNMMYDVTFHYDYT